MHGEPVRVVVVLDSVDDVVACHRGLRQKYRVGHDYVIVDSEVDATRLIRVDGTPQMLVLGMIRNMDRTTRFIEEMRRLNKGLVAVLWSSHMLEREKPVFNRHAKKSSFDDTRDLVFKIDEFLNLGAFQSMDDFMD